jgi:hypothetical protein
MRRGFLGGLTSALAKGATGYVEQSTNDQRALIALAAKRAAEQREIDRQNRLDAAALERDRNTQANAKARLDAEAAARVERAAERRLTEQARLRAEERAIRAEQRATDAARRAERTAGAGIDATNRAEENLTLSKLEANRKDRVEAAARQKAASAAVPLEERTAPDRTKPRGPDGRFPEVPTETGMRFLADSLDYDQNVVKPLEEYRGSLQRSLRTPAPAPGTAPSAPPRTPAAEPSPASSLMPTAAPSPQRPTRPAAPTARPAAQPWNPLADDLAAEQADWDEAVRLYGRAKVEQLAGPRPR